MMKVPVVQCRVIFDLQLSEYGKLISVVWLCCWCDWHTHKSAVAAANHKEFSPLF